MNVVPDDLHQTVKVVNGKMLILACEFLQSTQRNWSLKVHTMVRNYVTHMVEDSEPTALTAPKQVKQRISYK